MGDEDVVGYCSSRHKRRLIFGDDTVQQGFQPLRHDLRDDL